MPSRSYKGLFDLSGKVALLTGGTGILGRQYGNALADHGATVVVADLDEAACRERAAEISARGGPAALPHALDVADPAAVARLNNAVEAEVGPIDVLLNNAATKGDDVRAFFTPTERYPLDVWRQVMSVNLDGAFLVAQAIGTAMAGRGRGSIVNVGSIYGLVGPDQRIYEGSDYMGGAINTPAVYSASKAGVLGLTRYLATLWGKSGVRVNAITPGGVASGQNDVFAGKYGERVPLGRMAEADEMVGAVIYLASDASSYVTGHNLVIDGGWSIW